MTLAIGLDIGTSAAKAVLLQLKDDGTQTALAEASAPLEVSRPHPGWSEQQPDAWWTATRAVLGSLRRDAPTAFADVAALGLSGQMHALTALGADGQPLRPAMLWNDARAVAECAELTERVPDLGQIAGIGAMPGFTAPKLMWLARHEPAIAARIKKLLPAKDFVRLQLTGEAATDMADAAGTLWLDQRQRNWSERVLAASGADPDWMPRLVEGPAEAGRLRPAVAAELGLKGGLPLVAGAGDAAAAGIGIGHISAGDAYLSLGTSAQVFVTTDTYKPRPETLIHAFAHGLPGRWFQMAAMLNGASPLAAMARLLGRNDIEALLAETAAAAPTSGAERLLYLPYLAGERTPHDDAYARGVLFGLDGGVSQTDVVRAVLEGVACSLADAVDALAAAGSPLVQMGAAGGGAQSGLWMQLVADITRVPVTRFQGADKGPAHGAARLALALATGSSPEAVAPKPPVRDAFVPRPETADRSAALLGRFRALYQALRPEFRRLGVAPVSGTPGA
jgi:xylulokinase